MLSKHWRGEGGMHFPNRLYGMAPQDLTTSSTSELNRVRPLCICCVAVICDLLKEEEIEEGISNIFIFHYYFIYYILLITCTLEIA